MTKARWLEDGVWKESDTINGQLFGQHGFIDGVTSDCSHGCGCWMGPARSGGPVDPFGPCPKNPFVSIPKPPERRDPVPLSAKGYLERAMTGIDTGVKLSEAERRHMFREAWNHLENAAWAEAAEVDRLRAINAKMRRWCECMIEGLQHVAEVDGELSAHALGSMTDPEGGEHTLCIPAEFRKMFPDAKI